MNIHALPTGCSLLVHIQETKPPHYQGPKGVQVVTTTFVNMVVAPIRGASKKEAARQKMFQAGRDIEMACANAVDSIGRGVQEAGAVINRILRGGRGAQPAAGRS
jgi:hypothetical protein